MINLDDKNLMMIEPKDPNLKRVEDELTRASRKLVWEIQPSEHSFRGFHMCVCGARSNNRDHYIKFENIIFETNSLLVHYVEYHRSEIPETEMKKLISVLKYYGLGGNL